MTETLRDVLDCRNFIRILDVSEVSLELGIIHSQSIHLSLDGTRRIENEMNCKSGNSERMASPATWRL